MNVDRATGSCKTETVDRIIDRFRLWPEHSKLFPRHWIPEDLTTWPEIVRACTWLDLSEHRALTQDDVFALTKCAQIRHITHLDVSCGFATASAERAFFSASCFARCRALSVKTDTKEFEGFDVLAGCSSFPYLESLCLETSWIPRGGFIRFAGSVAAKKIRSLVLRCPDIGSDFVKRVFVRGNLSHVETFVFVCPGLSNWSMLELASCRALLRLRLLRIDQLVSDESNVMHALSDNPALGNLESLYLRGNSRDCSSALRTLAKPTNLSSLKDLSFAKNARSTRNTTPIRVVPGLKLRSWSVSNEVHFQRGRSLSARVSAGGEPDAVLRRLVVGPGDDVRGALTLDVIRGLTWIEVSNALVSSSDLSALFSSKWFRYVEALNLRVGDERLIDELVSRPISSLAAARITDSTRSATLAPRVLQSGAFPNVKSIVFERGLGRDWPRLNMVSARWASVGEFGAVGYQIEDEDFARVCEAPELEELRVLRFERCSLFPESIKRLRSATFKDGLEELHFDGTDVRGLGSQYLAHCELPNLRRLSLRAVKLRDEDAFALVGAPWTKQLIEFDANLDELGSTSLTLILDTFGVALQQARSKPSAHVWL